MEVAVTAKATTGSSDEILKKLINQAQVMLFMKGNAENPQCGMLTSFQLLERLYVHSFFYSIGFSRQAIALLKELKAEFGTFDIFTDEKVRQDLKTYSNWPTYPQV